MSAGRDGHGPGVRPYLLGLVVLLGLFLIADGIASAYVERRVADDLAESAGLEERPSVDIGGSPFLTQALAGTYQRVEVEAVGVDLGDGLRADRVTAVAEGVRVPLSDALGGGPGRIPVERLEARALLAFDDLEQRAAPDAAETLQLSSAGGDGGLVRVEALVRVLGREVTVTTDSEVGVAPGGVAVTAGEISVGDGEGLSGAAESVVNRLTGGELDFTVPVEGLPDGLELRDVEVVDTGIVAVVGGQGIVIDRGAAGAP